MVGTQTVRLENETDRWRYRCPNGHTTWEPTNHHFWCASCARMDDVDPSFDELRDDATGEHYARDRVRLEAPAGPYDLEVDG